MGSSPKVLCFGMVVADVVCGPVEEWPPPGELRLVESIRLRSGGNASNTATALTRLGIPTRLVGCLGEDPFGRFMEERLAAEGVEVSALGHLQDCATATTVVMTATGRDRSFLHSVGANARLTAQEVLSAWAPSLRAIHYAGALIMPALDGEPAAQIFRQAKEKGLLTSLDVSWDSRGRWMEALAPVLPYTDLFSPNLAEARALTGEDSPAQAAKALRGRGVQQVVIKLGEEGCWFADGAGKGVAPAFPVKDVDATGAGDAFSAGLLAALLKGMSLRESARFANAVGALCTLATGATAGLPSWEEAMRLLRTQPGNKIEEAFP